VERRARYNRLGGYFPSTDRVTVPSLRFLFPLFSTREELFSVSWISICPIKYKVSLINSHKTSNRRFFAK